MPQKISPALEDYLESVLILQKRGKVVRVKDMASLMKVKAPSVNEALASLQEKGLIIHERYGYVDLTSKGAKRAKKLYERHTLLKEFFHRVLGIKKELAEEDACKIEHYLSSQTMKRMLDFIKFIEESPEKKPEWLKRFQNFAENNTSPNGDKGLR